MCDYANQIVQCAMRQLQEYESKRRAKGLRTLYHTLVTAFHIDPASANEQPSYQDLAERFDMTIKAVERQLDHARKKLRGWLLGQLQETVCGEEELQEEIQFLIEHSRGLMSECL